ncbi:hypothetical protein fHeYen902_282 [Yersinia phage fHe-Yen9-02]|nr:hypothetical protein fHeYen902_282 [Yersinia phage fHe-Yen9-02]
MQQTYKEHTSYSSAFAIGEHAMMVLSKIDDHEWPLGQIVGVNYSRYGMSYDVAPLILDGSPEQDIIVHTKLPFYGIVEERLAILPTTGLSDKMKAIVEEASLWNVPTPPNSRYDIGDLVRIDFQISDQGRGRFSVPVLIYSVGYSEGTVTYGVSIDRSLYAGTKGWDNLYERMAKDCYDNIDCVLIEPVRGWTTQSTAVDTVA